MFFQNHEGRPVELVAATHEDRARVALRAFFQSGELMCVCAQSNVEFSFRQKGSPHFGAWLIFVGVAPDGNMGHEYTAPCVAEFIGFQFLVKKFGLLPAQVREIVQSVINPGAVGLVFAAVEGDKADASEGESAVGLALGTVEERWRAGGIGVAYLVVATDENVRILGEVKSFGHEVNVFNGAFS